MRSILISLATAIMIIIAEFTALPVLDSALPQSTLFAVGNVIRSLLLAACAGLAFFIAIRHLGYPSTSKRFPTAHRKLSLIISHVTFSFSVVLYPLTYEAVKFLGNAGAALIDASFMAVIIGAVAYWLTSLDSRTMNFGESSKTRSTSFDTKLFLGVLFASGCIAGVPILASVNQQVNLHKSDDVTEILNLAGRQRMFSQSIGRLAFADDVNNRQKLEQLLQDAEEQSRTLGQLTNTYAEQHDLVAADRNRLPENPKIKQLRADYIYRAISALEAESEAARTLYLYNLQEAIDRFLPAMEESINAFQALDHDMHESHKAGQSLRVLLGPIVFLGLSFGLFWPLLRLINAQRYGLDRRRRDAESAMVAKDQFLATVSHELRTPMNGILGMLRLLINSDLDEKQLKQATTALNSGNDLLTILNDILDLSKLERGYVRPESIAFKAGQLTEEVVALLSSQARIKGIEISCTVHGRVPEWAMGDPTRVRQVLLNLVGNAIKFTNTGNVWVKLRYNGNDASGVLRAEVKDTGIGIPEDSQVRIFDRFAQADASITRRFGGTGLGLSISRQLVELMGGTIGVKSTDGFGSTFWFTLPVRLAKMPEPEVAEEEDEVEEESDAPLKILAAEDNIVNQQVLTAFVTAAGHDVTVVDNGAEAIAALQQKDFDVVLMDIQMPVMDGIEATQKIRAFPNDKARIPIIAVTANAMEDDCKEYVAAGMNDHISKPLNPDKLQSKLDEIIEQRQQQQSVLGGGADESLCA